MKRSDHNPVVIIASIAMLVIVLLLAYLQYSWLGRLSEQEFERMQNNLRTAAFHCSMDAGQELMEVMKSLGGTMKGSDDQVRNVLLARVKLWKIIATHPQIVTDSIFIASSPSVNLTMVKTDNVSSLFLLNDLSAMTIPIQGRPGFSVFVPLDTGYIKSTWIPDIIQSNFSSDGKLTYDFVVADKEGKTFFSLTPADHPAISERADVTMPFLSIPSIPLSQMPPGRPPTRTQYGPWLEDGKRPNEPRPGGPGDSRDQAFGQRPQEPRDGDRGMEQQVLFALSIVHRDGSLEAAVNNNRMRSLGISFGVLLILGASVVVLLFSANRAQRLARQQLEFVAGVSHELRTPLSVLKSVGENLSDGIVQDKERTRQYGDLIKNEVIRLSEMVEQALNYAGIQSGKLTYERQAVDVSVVVGEALHEAKKRVPKGEFTIVTTIESTLPEIQGDATALRSAVENLITNAIKYSSDQKWIGIEARTVSLGEARVIEISVMDHGIGIPPGDIPNVFDPFYRGLNAIEGQVQGSGLGLSIAKHIVEVHGGSVSVESSVEEGSRFTIRLPIGSPPGDSA